MPLGTLLASCGGAAQRPSNIRIELVETKGVPPPPPAPPVLVWTDDPNRLREWLEELERRRRVWNERCERLRKAEAELASVLGRIAGGSRGRRAGPQDWCCGSEGAGEAGPATGVGVDELKKAYREHKKAVAAVDCATALLKAGWVETMGLLEARCGELRTLLQRCTCDCHGEEGGETRPGAPREAVVDEAKLEAVVARYVEARLAQPRPPSPEPAVKPPSDPAGGESPTPTGGGKRSAAG